MTMTIHITHNEYVKASVTEDGPSPDENVSDEFVEHFLAAKGFFDNLGSKETHAQDERGVITVAQVTPWGDERTYTFTPVPGTNKPDQP